MSDDKQIHTIDMSQQPQGVIEDARRPQLLMALRILSGQQGLNEVNGWDKDVLDTLGYKYDVLWGISYADVREFATLLILDAILGGAE